MATWIRRRVDGDLAQMLEPWHLRASDPSPSRPDWPTLANVFVGACGTPVVDVDAEADSPPEDQARCAACDGHYRRLATRS